MKKFTKIFAMMLVVMMVVGMFSTVAYAAGAKGVDFTTIGTSASSGVGDINDKVDEMGSSIISIITTVARLVAVGMLAVFAVKWMMATPQKKQELKERLVYLVIGVVLLFAGPSLLNLIANFGASI